MAATQAEPLIEHPRGDEARPETSALASGVTASPAPLPVSDTSTPAPSAPAEADAASPGPNDHVQDRVSQYGLSRENLEQEVGQVMGTLSSWWGGVKKQSVTALSTLKADLDKTVNQAQADFEQLRTAKVEVVRKEPEQFAAEQQAEKDRKSAQSAASQDDAVVSPSGGTLLDRITSSTTQLQHSLHTTLQSTLAAAATNPALANATDLTSHLAENLRLSSAKHNLQLSVKQAEKMAEGYLQKGEQLRKDAERWMSEAVKVVPPGQEGASGSGMSWDGSDWYAIVTQPAASSSSVLNAPLGDGRPKAPRSSTSSRALAGSRKDALLARLREDKDLVLVDPLSDSTPREQRQRFERWLSNTWPLERENAVATEGAMVGAVRMAVVPEHMTDEQFWQRYLYIRDTIIEEDEKRQQLLKAHEQSEQADDFKWDDEDENSTAKPAESATSSGQRKEKPTPSVPTTMPSAATSPRNSSEESYDVISDQAQATKVSPTGATKEKVKDDEDSEGSDWE